MQCAAAKRNAARLPIHARACLASRAQGSTLAGRPPPGAAHVIRTPSFAAPHAVKLPWLTAMQLSTDPFEKTQRSTSPHDCTVARQDQSSSASPAGRSEGLALQS